MAPTRWIRSACIGVLAAVLLPVGFASGYDDPYQEPPAPPYANPTVIVRFTWQPIEDLRFHYLLIPEAEDPLTSGFGAASWYAGCEEGALDPEPVVPLVLQDGVEPSRNWATAPGVYWVVVESDGYCIYLDQPGRLDQTLAAIPEGTEITVTATVEVYDEEVSGARMEVLSASIPVFLDVRELPATRKVLGSVTLEPGVNAVVGSTTTASEQSTTSSVVTTTTTTTAGGGEEGTTSSEAVAAEGTGTAQETESRGGTSRLGLFIALILIIIALGGGTWIKFMGIPRFLERKAREGDQERARRDRPPPPPPPPEQKTYQVGEREKTYVTTVEEVPPEPPPQPIQLRGEKKWDFDFVEGRTDGDTYIRLERGTRAIVLERKGRMVKLKTLSIGPDIWVDAKYVEPIQPPAPDPPPPPPG